MGKRIRYLRIKSKTFDEQDQVDRIDTDDIITIYNDDVSEYSNFRVIDHIGHNKDGDLFRVVSVGSFFEFLNKPVSYTHLTLPTICSV